MSTDPQGLQELTARVINIEALLGVKLPLKRVPGIEHLTSLPMDSTPEGRDKIAKDAEEAAKKKS